MLRKRHQFQMHQSDLTSEWVVVLSTLPTAWHATFGTSTIFTTCHMSSYVGAKALVPCLGVLRASQCCRHMVYSAIQFDDLEHLQLMRDGTVSSSSLVSWILIYCSDLSGSKSDMWEEGESRATSYFDPLWRILVSPSFQLIDRPGYICVKNAMSHQ